MKYVASIFRILWRKWVWFCEVHHLIPLHKSDGVIITKLSDLAIVCSNCHRIIHKTSPMISIDELSKTNK
ncbi:HNH endonuclease [Klebsiella pneumoniae]|uniref:HNH endonuclease n=1 Tax=Klebsiella pneumoniae TaxID=573 RepID=UPI001C869FF6